MNISQRKLSAKAMIEKDEIEFELNPSMNKNSPGRGGGSSHIKKTGVLVGDLEMNPC